MDFKYAPLYSSTGYINDNKMMRLSVMCWDVSCI